MAQINFDYNSIKYAIQCNKDEKIKDIIQRFSNKTQIDTSLLYFIYSGNVVDTNLTFNQIINNDDQERNQMNIIVINNDKNKQSNIIQSNNIICPECKEICRIDINDYKIKLYGCKNGHINDLLIDEFENSQKIAQSKIICDNCKGNNKNDSYKNIFYLCNSCNENLCPICKDLHNKNHIIINYDDRNYICKEHNDPLIIYCNTCKKNLCLFCEKDHNSHKTISYGKILPSDYQFDYLKNKIFEFNDNINEIMNKLTKIKENINIYYNIYKNMYNNYKKNKKNKNYEILQNLKINENIINEINNINKKININNIFEIYNKMSFKKEITIIYNIPSTYFSNKKAIVNKYEFPPGFLIYYDRIRIFGYNFVNNNYNKFTIKYNNKEYSLMEHFKIEDIKEEDIKNGKFKIKLINNGEVEDMSYMFSWCKALCELPDISSFNIEKVKDMCCMFSCCENLEKISNLSKWDTRNVKDMRYIFFRCRRLNLPNISKWSMDSPTWNYNFSCC